MSLHESGRLRESIVESDERQLMAFLKSRDFMAEKLPKKKNHESADFKISRDHKTMCFIELKSRFDDCERARIIDCIVQELTPINANLNYSIRIFNDYLPYPGKGNPFLKTELEKVRDVIEEKVKIINSSDKVFSPPIEIWLGTEQDLEEEPILINFPSTLNSHYKLPIDLEIIERQLKPDVNLSKRILISILGPNSGNGFRFISTSSSTLASDWKYFGDRMTKAASQLSQYDANFPKGVFFVEASDRSWFWDDKLSPFFVPPFEIRSVGNNDLLLTGIEETNILGKNSLTLISFYGFLSRGEGKFHDVDLYINPYAPEQLSIDIIKQFKCQVNWVVPLQDKDKFRIVRRYHPI